MKVGLGRLEPPTSRLSGLGNRKGNVKNANALGAITPTAFTFFTIASSPTEADVHLGVKFGRGMSSFKKALSAMQSGGKIYAGQLGGDFVLPRDAARKLVFIAGGIGITPFRSMVKDLADRGEKRDIVLLYANKDAEDIAYRPLLDDAARTLGLRTVYVMAEKGERIDAAFVTACVPDFRDRTFFLSGPTGMVDAFKGMLRGMGVRRRNIVTDYFPGFA